VDNGLERKLKNDLNAAPSESGLAALDRESGTWIGRFKIPFPFSAILSLIFLLLLLIGAAVSIPWMFVALLFARRQESRFALQMKGVGRLMSTKDVISRSANGGTIILEWSSFKDRGRIWWTADTISEICPYSCCFDASPWDFQDSGFFDWCRLHLTDPGVGSALLVNFTEGEEAELEQLFVSLRAKERCVSIGPHWR
jgi:hypothetical protein